jgi:hypothetical protein
MTKDEVKKIIDSMPTGMDVDDYMVEVVNRAIYLERISILNRIDDNIMGWDRDNHDAVLEATDFIRRRK